MINFSNFVENTKKGLIIISKVNDAFAITQRQFDKDTGIEILPEVVALDPKNLEVEKQKLLSMLSEIDAVLDHLKLV
ncbi:MAG: hypothetical protein A2Y67_03875 [Candidatus Buchananbacteria bacterium RBG_13_39_9]|uniref:Uncharacterized protein n=1 Tax=Candidatus Buchananbacteria bacterium RBG_13_39_9 TaxID=1797531 RepID=A0A1G1XQR5_9BACT|nr:MAG: hypothetical protein A2Y67_03875 [Candidatus Buchananbacteria bacterium RBG_13_39_9]